jgi:hypothetical protein
MEWSKGLPGPGPHFSPGGFEYYQSIGSLEQNRMTTNTVCYSSMPITVQASLRVRKLARHSNRSYGYAFRSRAALAPAPAPVILVRNAS